MTIEEINSMLENVANNKDDDALMLESFGKIREAIKEVYDKVDSLDDELKKSKDEYEKLRQARVKDFFNATDEVEEVTEEIEEATEDTPITVSDLFEDDVEVVDDVDVKKEVEDE
jgi:methyl-accepting chemotaxis protein